MNFLEGELDHVEGRFVGPDYTFRLASQVLSPLHALDKVTLGVRPEDVSLSMTAFEGGLPATVYVAEALGSETYVFLNFSRGRIAVRTDSAMRLENESRVWLSFDETRLHFFDCATGNRLP
jgi:ABC-type sugar transport system ATPase subunit